ncbi:MAG: M48 family metalloprotease [Magnetococcales bacterium]|nr:M48 family metalloprotease [Magnetococcales bacterium]
MTIKKMISLLALLMVLSACAVNPVTGKSELALISESQEMAIGKKQYGPSRQGQGGDYVADPALVTYVQQVGQRLAKVSDRQLPYEFVVINSSVPNAWALPGGKIAINRGLLLELTSEAELAAVLGHEIVHAAARHSAQGIERGMLMQGAVMAAGIATQNSGYSDLAIKGAGLAANLVNHKYGRDAERESDHYGMKYMEKAGYDVRAAIALQETFVRLSKSNNSNWLTGLFASHPPSQERVDNNRRDAELLTPGGEVGEARYQQAIAHLKKVKPAYDAYDEGVKALKEKKYDQARALAEKAISIEPKEGLFHALLGEAQQGKGAKNTALTSYSRAIQANPDFFYFYEKRGELQNQLGYSAGAKKDLERGAALFPTAASYLALGQFAEQEGNTKQAIEYYRDAAQSNSQSGRLAQQSLVQLDLQDHPSRYLKAHFVLDRAGRLLVSVKNPTDFPVDQLRVALYYLNQKRQREQVTLRLNGVVAPQQSLMVRTGIESMNGHQLRERGFQVQVVGARVAGH